MNRDEIMLWLNDRLGRPVTVTLYVVRGGANEDIFSAAGWLRHWSTATDDPEVVEWRAGLKGGLDELSAYYYIDEHGNTTIDLTGYDDVSGELHHSLPERLDIGLAEDLTLAVQFAAFGPDGEPLAAGE
jgi:hypothetical protein